MENTLSNNILSLDLPDIYTRKLIKDCDKIVEVLGDQLVLISLFGSCARGDYKVGSDLDVFVLTYGPIDRHIRGEIATELDVIDGISTDVVFYTLESFRHSNSLFINNVRKDGLILWKRE